MLPTIQFNYWKILDICDALLCVCGSHLTGFGGVAGVRIVQVVQSAFARSTMTGFSSRPALCEFVFLCACFETVSFLSQYL